MSAAEIGDAVGCSYQKVANWYSKVLAKKELINIEKEMVVIIIMIKWFNM